MNLSSSINFECKLSIPTKIDVTCKLNFLMSFHWIYAFLSQVDFLVDMNEI